MSRQWANTPARALHAFAPPPPHLVSAPPLDLLPPNSFVPGLELAIPGYACSIHVFPAAWPRSTPFASLPEDLQERVDESKEEKQTRIARATKYMLKVKATREREHPDGLDDSGRVLWVTATRWVRTSGVQAGDKTLLCTHANGLHGTTYAPILRRLLVHRQDVAEVWALDGVQHGDAGILNAGKNGILFDWHDIARDVLCFIQHFLPSEPTSEPMPSILPRISGGVRKVFALSHSYGRCTLVLAASHHPELFAAAML